MHTQYHKGGGGDDWDSKDWSSAWGGVNAKSPGDIRMEGADGTPTNVFTVDGYNADWWEVAKTLYPVVNGQMLIPASACEKAVKKTTRIGVGFMPCLATAGANYVESIWGRRLSQADKEWMARHPFAQHDGVAQQYTATCLHQFVEPYELGVSRIRLRPGSIADHSEYQHWMRSLGCNPFGVADHRTSNIEAAARLKMPLVEANKMFRFEFAEFPLQPSVIGKGEGGAIGAGVQVGSTMGHSDYLAPREKPPASWLISVQLAPLSTLTYAAPPVLPEYAERLDETVTDLSLTLADVLAPDGTFVAELSSGKYVRSDKRPKSAADARLLLARFEQDQKMVQPAPKTENALGVCYLCGLARHTDTAPHICTWCWFALWLDYGCPVCTAKGTQTTKMFRLVGAPKYKGAFRQTTGSLLWEIGAVCPCGQEIALEIRPERFYARALKDAIFGKKPTKLDGTTIHRAWDAAKPYISAAGEP